MPTYFKPLRRKIGVVTLVVACVFAAGWVRSISIADDFTHITDRAVYRLTSNNSRLVYLKMTIDDGATFVRILFQRRSLPARTLQYPAGTQWEWQWRFTAFEFGTYVSGTWSNDISIIPYWSIVVPLAALSAWLLLSKPRAKSEQFDSEDEEP